MLKLNRGDQAKHCFMEALALDVKCYDAFEQLISGEMMTPDEGSPLYSFSKYTANSPGNRMGVCARIGIQRANTRGRRLRAAHIHSASSEV